MSAALLAEPLERPLDTLERPLYTLRRTLDTVGRTLDTLRRTLDTVGRTLDTVGRTLNTHDRPLYTPERQPDTLERLPDTMKRAIFTNAALSYHDLHVVECLRVPHERRINAVERRVHALKEIAVTAEHGHILPPPGVRQVTEERLGLRSSGMSGMTPSELERAEALAERVLHRDAPRRRMLVIVNPYATTVSDRLKNLVVYALQSRYEVEAVDTQAKLHATELCREAADEGYEVVVAFGGDGTVNEAANGLIGTDVPLTCLPGGSTNVFCRSLGIPRDVVDATEHLLQVADRFEPRRVDLGRVNGRHFTFSSGIGLDASVVEQVDSHPKLKSRYTRWYYTYVAVTQFMRKYLIDPPRVRVEVEGQTLEGVTVVVQNSDPFTYFGKRPIRVNEGAALDNGTLSLSVLERATMRDMPTLIPRLFSARSRTVQRHRQVTGFTGIDYAHVVATDGAFPLQVDGDFIGEFEEASYGVVPNALSVVS